MAKTDTELLLAQVSGYLQNNLSAKLTEITNEKNDGLVLLVPDPASYFIQVLFEESLNMDPYVFIGIKDPIGSDSIGQGSAQQIPIEIAFVLADSGVDLMMWKRLYRYQRALKEIFELGWNKAGAYPRMDVSTYMLQVPEFKKNIVGVQLKINLT